jgi:nitroreductase
MKNPVTKPVNGVFQKRWSPYTYDPGREVSAEDLESLFEAARWSMSSFNAQPWRYIVGARHRFQEVWQRVFDVLLEGNQAWAKNAPVLALGLAEHNFEYNGKPNKAALHDLGAASASLTYEATFRGLVVHQMIGIDPDRARDVFKLGNSVEPFTAMAIGYPADGSGANADLVKRDNRERLRKSLGEIIIEGGF